MFARGVLICDSSRSALSSCCPLRRYVQPWCLVHPSLTRMIQYSAPDFSADWANSTRLDRTQSKLMSRGVPNCLFDCLGPGRTYVAIAIELGQIFVRCPLSVVRGEWILYCAKVAFSLICLL